MRTRCCRAIIASRSWSLKKSSSEWGQPFRLTPQLLLHLKAELHDLRRHRLRTPIAPLVLADLLERFEEVIRHRPKLRARQFLLSERELSLFHRRLQIRPRHPP